MQSHRAHNWIWLNPLKPNSGVGCPAIGLYFTTAQINALIAPRPHISVAGNLDALTPVEGLDRIDSELKHIYSSFGQPDVSLQCRAHGDSANATRNHIVLASPLMRHVRKLAVLGESPEIEVTPVASIRFESTVLCMTNRSSVGDALGMGVRRFPYRRIAGVLVKFKI